MRDSVPPNHLGLPHTAPNPALPTPGEAFADHTFDAVLFDMDGTLINSIPITERCWGIWMQEYGFPADHFHQFHGTPAKAIAEQLLPEEEWERGFQRIVELEMNETDGIIVLPGTTDALAAVPPQARAIVTSCTRGLALLRLNVTGLDMPTLVCADDVERGKPYPDPYLRGAQLLGVDPSRCLVVEDAPSGLRAGRVAGAKTIAVPGTNALEDLDADAYAQGLDRIEFVWDMSAKQITVRDRMAGTN